MDTLTYPLTHRTGNYHLSPTSSDYFPILRLSPPPDCIRVHYFINGVEFVGDVCGGGGPTCSGMFVIGSFSPPSGNVGVVYNYSFQLGGTAPFDLDQDNSTIPTWMTVGIVGDLVTLSGTPDTEGDETIILNITNCDEFPLVLPFLITIGTSCVNVTVPSFSLPDAEVGVAYFASFNLAGTPPFAMPSESVPSWMIVNLDVDTGLVEFSGTPLFGDSGTGISVTLDFTNCTAGTDTFTDTITVVSGGVDLNLIFQVGLNEFQAILSSVVDDDRVISDISAEIFPTTDCTTSPQGTATYSSGLGLFTINAGSIGDAQSTTSTTGTLVGAQSAIVAPAITINGTNVFNGVF